MKNDDLIKLVQTVDLAPVENIADEVEQASSTFAQKFTALGIDILRLLPQWAESHTPRDIRGSTLRYTLTPDKHTPSPATDTWKEHVLPFTIYQAPETRKQLLFEILQQHTPQLDTHPRRGYDFAQRYTPYNCTHGDPWVYCTLAESMFSGARQKVGDLVSKEFSPTSGARETLFSNSIRQITIESWMDLGMADGPYYSLSLKVEFQQSNYDRASYTILKVQKAANLLPAEWVGQPVATLADMLNGRESVPYGVVGYSGRHRESAQVIFAHSHIDEETARKVITYESSEAAQYYAPLVMIPLLHLAGMKRMLNRGVHEAKDRLETVVGEIEKA